LNAGLPFTQLLFCHGERIGKETVLARCKPMAMVLERGIQSASSFAAGIVDRQ
jgi:hypothetical protein